MSIRRIVALCAQINEDLEWTFLDEIARQLQKSNVKAIITSTAIASAVRAAANACLPSLTPFIVINDQCGSMPEKCIPFDVSIVRKNSRRCIMNV